MLHSVAMSRARVLFGKTRRRSRVPRARTPRVRNCCAALPPARWRNWTSSRATARRGVRRSEGARRPRRSATRRRGGHRAQAAADGADRARLPDAPPPARRRPCRFDVVVDRASTQAVRRVDRGLYPERRSMPELRRDPVTGRWVIISTDRQKRPNDFRLERAAAIGREHCPFCAGHEAMTPPEVLRVPARTAARRTRRAGTCASCRTSFRRCRSRARSIAKARACSTG